MESYPRRSLLTPRQADVLRKVLEEYRNAGFRSTTIEQLAARIGCSKSTLYSIGATRKELDDRVIRLHFSEVDERIELVVGLAGPNASGRLRSYLIAVGEEARRLSPEFIEDIGSSSSRDIGVQWLGRVTQRVRDLVAAYSPEATAEARIRVAFLAETIVSVINEIEYGGFRDRVKLDHAEAYAQLASLADMTAPLWLSGGLTGAERL